MDISITEEEYDGFCIMRLTVDGQEVAKAVSKAGRPVEFTWEIYGPQYWPKAQQIIQGLVQLSVVADAMYERQRTQ